MMSQVAFATDQPKWRNWQTRQVQDLVPVQGVEVRVLSSAPGIEGLGSWRLKPFVVFHGTIQSTVGRSLPTSDTWVAESCCEFGKWLAGNKSRRYDNSD